MIDDKTRADVLREYAERIETRELTLATPELIRADADKLDQTLPEPGTVVWWRWQANVVRWNLGMMHVDGSPIIVRDDGSHVNATDVPVKPARILAPDEVALKVPPLCEWPKGAKSICPIYKFSVFPDAIITRAEAEKMEVSYY